jgi:hypothetical protein
LEDIVTVDLTECRLLATHLREAEEDSKLHQLAADRILELVDYINDQEMQIAQLRKSIKTASDEAVRSTDA